METSTHQRLKLLALAFLREHGCLAAACEVRCPIARYRVDVAGYADRPPRTAVQSNGISDAAAAPEANRKARRVAPRTIMIECKQSRADFLRDRRDLERLLRERRALDHFRGVLEERRIRREEPELRRTASALFPELEEWDFASSRLPAYRNVIRRLRKLDELLHGETKFCMIARYALADRLYLATPAGMIQPRELPPGWGLLEARRSTLRNGDPNADLFGETMLQVRIAAPVHAPRDLHRQRILRNIAVAASAAASHALGVSG